MKEYVTGDCRTTNVQPMTKVYMRLTIFL